MSLIRIQKQVHQVIADHLRTIAPPRATSIVTITQVLLSADLALVKVYLNLFDLHQKEHSADLLKNWLAPHHFAIRQVLAQQLRHKIRKVPTDIRFYNDQHGQKAQALEALLVHLAAETK